MGERSCSHVDVVLVQILRPQSSPNHDFSTSFPNEMRSSEFDPKDSHTLTNEIQQSEISVRGGQIPLEYVSFRVEEAPEETADALFTLFYDGPEFRDRLRQEMLYQKA